MGSKEQEVGRSGARLGAYMADDVLLDLPWKIRKTQGTEAWGSFNSSVGCHYARLAAWARQRAARSAMGGGEGRVQVFKW